MMDERTLGESRLPPDIETGCGCFERGFDLLVAKFRERPHWITVEWIHRLAAHGFVMEVSVEEAARVSGVARLALAEAFSMG